MILLMAALVVNSQTNIIRADQYDRTPINIDNIKTPVTEFINRHYTGFIIKQATRVFKNNVITFEIIIVQSTTTDTLIFDRGYNIVREIVQKEDSFNPAKKKKL